MSNSRSTRRYDYSGLLMPERKRNLCEFIMPGSAFFGGGSGPPLPAVHWNPADAGAHISLSDTDLTAAITLNDGTWNSVRANVGYSSGKYQFEIVDTVASTAPEAVIGGLAKADMNLGGYVGSASTGAHSFGIWNVSGGAGCAILDKTGSASDNGGSPTQVAPAVGSGVVFTYLIDLDNLKYTVMRNGLAVCFGSLTAGTWYPAVSVSYAAARAGGRFTAAALQYPMAGYLSWSGEVVTPLANNGWDRFAINTTFNASPDMFTVTGTVGGWRKARGAGGKTSGKWQHEVLLQTSTPSGVFTIPGFIDDTSDPMENSGAYVGLELYSAGFWGDAGGTDLYFFDHTTGVSDNGGSGVSHNNGGVRYNAGASITVCLDIDALTYKIKANGTTFMTGTLPAGKTWYPAVSLYGSAQCTGRFTASQIVYPEPSYTAWNDPLSAWEQGVFAFSPILFFNLNETGGTTVADSSGNGLTGTISTGPVQFNQPRLFPGIGPTLNLAIPGHAVASIQVGDNALLDVTGDFTILIALNMLAAVGWYQKLFWKITDLFNGKGTFYLGIDLGGGTIRGRVNVGGAYYDVTSPSQISAGTSYICVLRRIGTELSLWLGALGGSFSKIGFVTLPPGAVLDTNTANPLVVSGAGNDSFNGEIGTPILFGSGLSDAALMNLWTIANT
jgi:hypothetical protein